MSVRDLVTFRAEFPEDAQWDEADHLLVPGGRAIADYLRTRLEQRDFSCTDLIQHEDYGWGFDVAHSDLKVTCLLQGGTEWFLLLKLKVPLLSRLLRANELEAFEEIQDRIQQVLMGDKRFSHVLWSNNLSRKYGSKEPGSPTPR